MVHFERFGDIRAAIAREKEIKAWRREKKIWLIERDNPTWADLAEHLPAEKQTGDQQKQIPHLSQSPRSLLSVLFGVRPSSRLHERPNGGSRWPATHKESRRVLSKGPRLPDEVGRVQDGRRHQGTIMKGRPCGRYSCERTSLGSLRHGKWHQVCDLWSAHSVR